MSKSNHSPSPDQHSSVDQNGSSHRVQRAEQSIATIADESINRDLEDGGFQEETSDAVDGEHTPSRTLTRDPALSANSLIGDHRRPSYIANGPRPFLGWQQPDVEMPIEQDREAAISEERSLLRDNNLIPPKHPRRRSSHASASSGKGLKKRLSIPGLSIPRRKNELLDEESGRIEEPSETTGLLPDSPRGDLDAPYEGEDSNIDQKFSDAVLAGEIHTTWQRETKVLAAYALPLMFTFILQNSLTLTSVFVVGRIGTIEMGAVSIGAMTANITGYAVYHGLATSLDTLCAQAYGSGNKKLVGLNLQRMVFFLWTCTIPIGLVWFFASSILSVIVPEKEIAVLAGRYLKILIIGAPAYAAFESGKRFVQAQGKFTATLYVLLIAAPTNVMLQYLFVWQFNWGFVGTPIAIVIVEYMMPILLILYVRFVGGMDCWPGFSARAFANWGPMIRLALPGFVMLFAEFLAFEILTLAAARFSSTHLAANTILQSMTVLAYNLPFPVSVAGSTRVANFIGAGLPDAGKVTSKVMFVHGAIVGVFNMVMIASLRFYIPHLYTQDPEVIALAAATLPVNAAFQLVDALAAQCNGILRGLGKQSIGGILSLVAFYGIAIPVSFGTGFGLDWKLYGLWTGPAIGLLVQSTLEGVFIKKTSWAKASEEAAKRNAAR